MSLLPKKSKSPIIHQDPEILLLVGHHGTGKTVSVAQLPNNLIVDCESRSEQAGGLSIDLPQKAVLNATHLSKIPVADREYHIWKAMISEMKQEVASTGQPVYDFITTDSTSSLVEAILKPMAKEIFLNTTQGKSWLAKNGQDMGFITIDV